VTRLLVDTSVLIKWFHAEGERELVEARAIRDAHVAGEIDAHVLDLAFYEVGNVLVRALSWPPVDVADQLDDLLAILGPPIGMARNWLHDAAHLAHRERLSYYDASWAAAAQSLRIPLVSADSKLVATGLASSPSDIVSRLQLQL
jgi:predicted nucleic acid-binding protein